MKASVLELEQQLRGREAPQLNQPQASSKECEGEKEGVRKLHCLQAEAAGLTVLHICLGTCKGGSKPRASVLYCWSSRLHSERGKQGVRPPMKERQVPPSTEHFLLTLPLN